MATAPSTMTLTNPAASTTTPRIVAALGHGAGRTLLALSGLLALIGLWWVGVLLLERDVPLAHLFTPDKTFVTLYELLRSGQLNDDMVASLRRVGVSLLLAIVAGVPIGLAVGSWHRFDAGTSVAFQVLRMISPLSWMPIAVMAFGIGDSPIYFMLAITAVWPIVINTAAGVRCLDGRWLMLSRSLSATRWETLRRVVLPGVVGHFLTGVRVAIGMIWILLVPCEMLGVTSGLGYYILDTRDRLAYGELMATIVLIGIFGFLLDTAIREVQRRWAGNR